MLAAEVGAVCVSVAKGFFQTSLLFELVGLGVDNLSDTTSLLVLSTIYFCPYKE